jgi:signal transduction histidine kinase/CheY-like chemotaxis protein/HPt (histidine-containing phosphotransfer) domain-containing protein
MRQWYSKISLQTKISGIALLITTLSLAVVAAANILQIRNLVAAEEHRSADSVALGFARSAELAMAVGDKQELSRLTNSFIRDQNVLFIAAFNSAGARLADAARDPLLWQHYQSGTLDSARCVLGEHQIETTPQVDEFSADSDPDSLAKPLASHSPKIVGRVVVGISTAAALAAQHQQNRLTLLVTTIAAGAGGLILFLTLGHWMRRLQKLAEASWAISGGNFSGAIHDNGNDEIGRLAKSFDDMRGALRKRDQELRRFTETLQDQVNERTRDLQTALTAAEEANKAKSLFLANMSHELRTPLNGVIGMVDLLLAAEPNQQQRRYCDIAKSSARSLVELINDILDFSKIEAGKLELDNTDFNLHEAVESVTQIMGDRAQKKGIELLCRVNPQVPRIVGGDPVRLRQVILNLVSNAVKFTEKGEVVIDARVDSQDDQATQVRISVSDSGIGIPKNRLDRLFKSFSQVDASTTRKFGGTGLGLAISQRIVEMMQGTIGVFSEDGKGSTFWFTVKLARRSQATALRKESSADPRGLRVLAVDDNQTNREILQSQLASWSLRADIAVDAEQAVGMLKTASQSGDPYRFAILDMHMPKTDGMELASTIKNNPLTSDVILISLSSISDQIKREQMNEHGFAACLTKPVLPSQLYDTIVTSLAENEEDHASAEVPRQPGSRLDGVRVLLAEDNEVNRLVATELLELIGCQVQVAVNGKEAVDKALAGTFDIMLMDCQMPILDGFEATRKIRDTEAADGNHQHRKIIALTANAIKGDRELCIAAGMDEYLTKPIEPADLLKTIHLLLPAKRAAEVKAAERSADNTTDKSVDASAPTAPAEPPKPAGPPPVDIQTLTLRCVNNRKLAAKALRMFDAGIDRDLAALTKSIHDANPRAVAASAHKIKGAAANVSAESVRQMAAELEKMGRSAALDQTQLTLDQLNYEVAELRRYLDTALQQLLPAEPPKLPKI